MIRRVNIKRGSSLLILIITILGCKKPYNPPVIAEPGSYLVVEGTINTGSDSTIFKLSRTVSISTGNAINPETGAIVTVESNANKSYPLTEITKGYYATVGLNLDNTLQYRLRIQTLGKDQYLSDFVPVEVTPPIDSVGYAIASNGVNLYVNTHDPTNNIKYNFRLIRQINTGCNLPESTNTGSFYIREVRNQIQHPGTPIRINRRCL